jgi:hypothetical protein
MKQPASPPPIRDSKSNLYEAAVAAVKDRKEKAAAEARGPQPKSSAGTWVFALIGAAGLVILMLQPAWLVGPKSVPQEPPTIVAASIRLTLIRERERVFDFANRRGRLPTDLSEAGGGTGLPDILYERTGGDSFRLSAPAGDSIIVLRSNDSMALFLGTSLKEIKNRGRL